MKEERESACPIDHSNYKKSTGSECPVDHGKQELKDHGKQELNPKNNMPHLSQEMANGQSIKLTTERETSNIPKSSAEKNHLWEYPSSQVEVDLKELLFIFT
jgi:cytochrome c heme-lyase